MRATAEGYAGPLQKATFYKGLGNNLISAAKLYADSNVSIIMIKTGMSLVHHDAAAKFLHNSAAFSPCRTTPNGLHKVQLRRLEQVLYRVKSRHQHRRSWRHTLLKQRLHGKRRSACLPSPLRIAFTLPATLVGHASSSLLRHSGFSALTIASPPPQRLGWGAKPRT